MGVLSRLASLELVVHTLMLILEKETLSHAVCLYRKCPPADGRCPLMGRCPLWKVSTYGRYPLWEVSTYGRCPLMGGVHYGRCPLWEVSTYGRCFVQLFVWEIRGTGVQLIVCVLRCLCGGRVLTLVLI